MSAATPCIWADGSYGDGLNGVSGGVGGLLTKGDVGQFLAQVTDVVVLVAFCSIMTIVFFNIMKRTMGMRSTEEAEVAGLDMPEMGALAYPDFLEAQGPVFRSVDAGSSMTDITPVSAASLREEVGSR